VGEHRPGKDLTSKERDPQLERIRLAHGQITVTDQLLVELIRPTDTPALIRILWPVQPTVTNPAQFPDTAAMVARLFASAATRVAAIKRGAPAVSTTQVRGRYRRELLNNDRTTVPAYRFRLSSVAPS
jgi:hypothetical protein